MTSGESVEATVRDEVTRVTGLVLACAYAGFLAWLLTAQPRTMAEAVGGVASGFGAYSIDAQAFADGLLHFRADRFAEARAAFAGADPARRDARSQFYTAYSFYRQGWRRSHRDDALFNQGLQVIDYTISIAPGGRLVVDDPDLRLRSADELRAEIARGLNFDASDLNPLRLFEARK